MIITIKKNAKKDDIEKALKKMQKHTQKNKGNLRQFFGAAPMEVDGLTFQKEVRKEWD